MNVVAHLWLAQRFELRPPVDIWETAGLPGIDLGRELFASGHLDRLAEGEDRIESVLDDLMARYHQRKVARSPCPPLPSSPAADVPGRVTR